MGLFKYPSIVSSRDECQSKISRELAEQLADNPKFCGSLDYNVLQRLKLLGVSSYGAHVFNDRYKGKAAYDYGPAPYHYDAAAFAKVDGLPPHWWCDVHAVRSERQSAKRAAELAAKVEAFEAPAPVKRRLLALHAAGKVRGYSAPDNADLSGLKPLREYKPEGGCGAKLKLKGAVLVSSEQNSYSDDLVYLVPVDGEIGDSGACQRNLNRWCEAIRSHNGFAGSGSSYSAALAVEPDGAYVELHCRASIAD